MTRVHAFTISFPPRRFIGAELMTARLLADLHRAGHRVSVTVGDGNGDWDWDGVPVSGNALKAPRHADALIVHAGRSWPGVEHRHRYGGRLVMICHNTSAAVHDDVAGARPDLVVVNSRTMASELGVDALVINPPAPPAAPPRRGAHITTLSLNVLKGGPQFWAVAQSMPDLGFLAVRGGYGSQVLDQAPNVEVLDHVRHDLLDDQVWSRTGVFLQLSSSESWGMAAAEAIAHGIPVIAHPTPGIRENLGHAAIYVDRDDTAGIVAAVRTVLADWDTYSQRAVRRARRQRATSAAQRTRWVSTIERLGHATDQRNGAASGALARVG